MFVSEITQLGFCYNSPRKVNLRVTSGLILSLLSVFSAETDDNTGKDLDWPACFIGMRRETVIEDCR